MLTVPRLPTVLEGQVREGLRVRQVQVPQGLMVLGVQMPRC